MDALYRFSRQEEKVLLLAIAGSNDNEIAVQMGVGLGTVRTFWKRIRSKSGNRTRDEILDTFRNQQPEVGLDGHENLRLLAEISRRERLESILKSIIELVPDGVLAADESGLCIAANSAAMGLLGRPESEIEGQRVSDLVADRTHELSAQGAVAILPDTGGAKAESFYERALGRAGVGHAVVRRSDGVIIFANDRFGDLLGREPDQFVSRKLSEIVAGSDRPRVDQALQRAMSNGEAQAGVTMVHRNGSFVGMYFDATFLEPDDGGQGHFVLTVRRVADSGRMLSARSSRIG